MRMHFSRTESGEPLVQLIRDEIEEPFDYIKLIKHLIEKGELQQATFAEAFSPEEKAAVNSMVQKLVEACQKRRQAMTGQ